MSGTDKAPVLSLERVDRAAIQWATFAAITLFALFWVCVKKWNLPVYGNVPAGKVLWSVLISPITEELFFRGLMYSQSMACVIEATNCRAGAAINRWS
jgi:membrane protease YdiL (CAAX protease family)